MARIVKEEEYLARCNEILDAALQLVYSKGYGQMTIQDILDQLRISKGAFYHYFDSKAAVLDALVERMVVEQVKPLLLSIVRDPHLTALEKLQGYFDTTVRWKTAKKALMMELLKVWYSDENVLARQKMLATMVKHVTPLFMEIIRQGVQEGVFTTPYPEIASQIMLNLIYDLAYVSGQLFIVDHSNLVEARQTAAWQQAETLFAAYSDALERILGAPKGSIHPMSAEVLDEWFSAGGTLEKMVQEAGIPGSRNP